MANRNNQSLGFGFLLIITFLVVVFFIPLQVSGADLAQATCTTEEAHEQELATSIQRGYESGYTTGYSAGGNDAMLQLAEFIDVVCEAKGSGFLIMHTAKGGTGIVCQ